MIDHANQLALSEIAREGRVEVGSVIGQLGETAKQLCEFARDQDIPFEEVILGILHGRRYRAANSKPRREVPSVASTEA